MCVRLVGIRKDTNMIPRLGGRKPRKIFGGLGLGVDIFGLNPKNGEGEYFRSKSECTVILCEDILDEELEMVVKHDDGTEESIRYRGWQAGQSNDGYIIGAEKAEEIGRRIMKVLEEPRDRAKKIADKIKGDKYQSIASKIRELLPPDYTLDRDFLKKWAEFCLNCGGFEVC